MFMLSCHTVHYNVIWLLSLPFFSIGIESVVDNGERSSIRSDAMCTACEMAVVWMQNQLKQNKTQELILNYINEVNLLPV